MLIPDFLVNLYQRIVGQEDVHAQFNLAVNYMYGIGVETDDKKAVELYQKAASQGHADAQYILALCYASRIGVEKDDEKAVAWYQKAADQGHASAQNNLAMCYDNGIGVEKTLKRQLNCIKELLTKEMPMHNIILLCVIKMELE
jgi:uncharacterized protein